MKETLAILGSGHLGQQIAHYSISDKHYKKVVFFDDFSCEKFSNGIPIIGNSDLIESEFHKKSFDELIIGIGYRHLKIRKEMFERFMNKVPLGKIIHTTSWVDPSAQIKDGCIIYPSCCIDAKVCINENSILNIACTIAHDTKVGKHCFLSPRVALAGFIDIGDSCIIGINATMIDSISVAANTQIGGGTVVIKNITDSGLYVGNPQRKVR